MRVIEIDPVTKIVTQVKYVNDDYKLSTSEQKTDQGDLGQKFVDGKFVNVPVNPSQPIETMEQKIARLEQQLTEQNLVQMEVLATIYEQILGGA